MILNECGEKIKNAQAVELHNIAGSLTEDKVKSMNFDFFRRKENGYISAIFCYIDRLRKCL